MPNLPFWKSGNEGTYRRSDEDRVILDMYASYEDIAYSRSDELKQLDEYERLNRRIDAAERLLAAIPVGKFSDVRMQVTSDTIQAYTSRGMDHSLQHRATHPNNIQAIADFSRAIELSKSVNEVPKQSLFEARGYCYLHQKMSDKAIEDANSILTESESANAYLLRGEAYSQLGNYDRAKADLTYAMAIANRYQERSRAFYLYSSACHDIVTQHQRTLQEVVQQYKEGKRDFSQVDLSWIDLSNFDFTGANLQGANLECTDLSHTNLAGATLNGANLRYSFSHGGFGSSEISINFHGAHLENANLSGVFYAKADFRKANLSNAHLSNAQLSYANFVDANLVHTTLIKADLRSSKCRNSSFKFADLSEARLGSIDLTNAELVEANLSRANLQQATLTGANLEKANLSDANLFEVTATHANFSGARLSGATLAQANLRNSNLQDADFANANLFNANLTEANIVRTNVTSAEDLVNVQGISGSLVSEWKKRKYRS